MKSEVTKRKIDPERWKFRNQSVLLHFKKLPIYPVLLQKFYRKAEEQRTKNQLRSLALFGSHTCFKGKNYVTDTLRAMLAMYPMYATRGKNKSLENQCKRTQKGIRYVGSVSCIATSPCCSIC